MSELPECVLGHLGQQLPVTIGQLIGADRGAACGLDPFPGPPLASGVAHGSNRSNLLRGPVATETTPNGENYTVGMTDVDAPFLLSAEEARNEALLVMARRETGRSNMTLAEAEEWFTAECSRLGRENSWPSR